MKFGVDIGTKVTIKGLGDTIFRVTSIVSDNHLYGKPLNSKVKGLSDVVSFISTDIASIILTESDVDLVKQQQIDTTTTTETM